MVCDGWQKRYVKINSTNLVELVFLIRVVNAPFRCDYDKRLTIHLEAKKQSGARSQVLYFQKLVILKENKNINSKRIGNHVLWSHFLPRYGNYG